MIKETGSVSRFHRTLGHAVATVSALAALASLAAATSWQPACDETRTGQYAFEGLGGSAGRPVRIYLCPDVRCTSKTEFATVTKDAYSAPMPKELARPYFLVERQGESKTAERRIIAARHLVLEGAFNFRDLGGLETRDGKTVRWGQVFRSDTLTRLTAADYQRLNGIGISLVCDLRTRQERKTDPTEWQDGSPVFVLAPVSEDSKGTSQNGNLAEALQSGKMSVEDGKALFEQFYTRMIFDSASKFGAVLRAIETSDRPAMFHCTGGRDRTGITAALLLEILGVPRQTIVSDFVLSTRYLNEGPSLVPAPQTEAERQQATLYNQVIMLQPRYIEAVFKAIDQRYRGFDRYRREALHFTDSDVVALKSRLLE